MNILILAAGEIDFTIESNDYPFYLTEFNGISLIERLVSQCHSLQPTHFLFAFPEEQIKKWRLDNIVSQLASPSQLIRVPGKTAGAICTALLAIDYIDNNEPLLILNANDILQVDFKTVLTHFAQQQLDAGTIIFPSIHPRYSYVALDENEFVIETAEKNPISRHATAGFYWFRKGRQFITASHSVIIKDMQVNGCFYICPVFNELILTQAKIGVYKIEKEQYHPLKSLRQIQQFDTLVER